MCGIPLRKGDYTNAYYTQEPSPRETLGRLKKEITMKRYLSLVSPAVFVILTLIACAEPRDIVVMNSSSNSVTYTMYGKPDTFTIIPGETQLFTETKAEPVSFSGDPHPVGLQ
jgi:hypothetical protein